MPVEMSFNNLSVLAKRQRPAVDIQHTRDGVSMSEVRQDCRLLAVVIKVTTVRTVQPHVGSRPMTVVSYWPVTHSDACSLIAAVLLHHVKLNHHRHVVSNYPFILVRHAHTVT